MPETTGSTEPYIHKGISHSIEPCRYCIFYKLKVCGNTVSGKSFGAIFLNICSFCVSVSHFGNSCSISNFFIIVCYNDLWCYYYKKTMIFWRGDNSQHVYFFICLCGWTLSQLWQAGSLNFIVARRMWTLSCGIWDLVPWPGIKPGPSILGVQS